MENSKWSFDQRLAEAEPGITNLSVLLEGAVLQLRKEMPLQLVVNMFQKMVSSGCLPCVRQWAHACVHRTFGMCCSRKKANYEVWARRLISCGFSLRIFHIPEPSRMSCNRDRCTLFILYTRSISYNG